MLSAVNARYFLRAFFMPRHIDIGGCLSLHFISLDGVDYHVTFDEAGNGSRSFFLPKSQKSHDMKTTSLTVSSSRSHGNDIFSWATIAHLYNTLTFGACHCESSSDAKQYTKVLLIVLSGFILAGIYDAILTMEGGLS